MHLQKEHKGLHTITGYSASGIRVGNTEYAGSILVSAESIWFPWPVSSLEALDAPMLEPVIETRPDVLIIGHTGRGILPPGKVLELLSGARIGWECMEIGAACRTFNVLLGEGRNVTGAFIPGQAPGKD